MIIPKTREEIELMRESALIVSKTLGVLASEIKPGITTLHLDKIAEEHIRDLGAIPGFLGLYDFPNTLCISPLSSSISNFSTELISGGEIRSLKTTKLSNEDLWEKFHFEDLVIPLPVKNPFFFVAPILNESIQTMCYKQLFC